MKKLLQLCTFASLLLSQTSLAQEKLYLQFGFMRVEEGQHFAYMETEDFWEKIHQQFANNGDIVGWDLWSLLPGGQDQGCQYLVVTVYDDPVKMLEGFTWDQLMAATQKAYPELSEDDIFQKIPDSIKSRELAVALYMENIAGSEDDFELEIGTVAAFNLMKVDGLNRIDYEKAEQEVFLPRHQEAIKAGRRASWGLWRVISPRGSAACASHVTVDMFRDYDQFLSPPPSANLSEEQIETIREGFKTRDMKWTYMGTLLKKVRKNTDTVPEEKQPKYKNIHKIAKPTTRKDFKEFCEINKGRWIGEITRTADIPGVGKKGEKLTAHFEGTVTHDGNAFAWKSIAGHEVSSGLTAYDAATKQIIGRWVSSTGITGEGISCKIDGIWYDIAKGCLIDGTETTSYAELSYTDNGNKLTVKRSDIIGNKKTDVVHNVWHRIGK